MKKQGKVKTLSIKNPKKGSHVIWALDPNRIYVIVYYEEDNPMSVTINREGNIRNACLLDLKELVIEYEQYSSNELGINWDNGVKQIPLKYSQWQAAINNGEVDSDKVVTFELTHREIRTKQDAERFAGEPRSIARIIPNKEVRSSSTTIGTGTEHLNASMLYNRYLSILNERIELASSEETRTAYIIMKENFIKIFPKPE